MDLNYKDDYAELSVSGKKKLGLFNYFLAFLFITVGFLVVMFVYAVIPREFSILATFVFALYLCAGIPFCLAIVRSSDVEYDYLYIENDLEIDKVINKSRRKHVLTLHLAHAKRIAPEGSPSLGGYEGRGTLTVKDYTSGDESKLRYVVIMEKDEKPVKILIEPDTHMKDLMKYRNKEIFYEE